MAEAPQRSDVERVLLDHKLVEKASRLAAAFADAKAEAARVFDAQRRQIEAEYAASKPTSPLPRENGNPAPPG